MAKNPALRAVSGGSAKAANRGEPFPGGKSARFTPLTIRSASDEAHKVAWQQKTSYRRKFMGTVRAMRVAGNRHFGPNLRHMAAWAIRKVASTVPMNFRL